MKNLYKIILMLAVPCFLAACNKEEFEPYDNPFIHIHVDNQDTVFIRSNRKDEVTYYVYLSAKRQFDPIDVTYSITPGNGLQPNRDYKIMSAADNKLRFMPGVFEMPIKIAWLENPVDPTKNNSLTIKIESNSKDFTMGLPGPSGLQKQLVIIKNN